MDIFNLISRFPINASRKLSLMSFVRRLVWYFKYDKQKFRFLVENQVFANSNHYYGHEYWLKKYSGYSDTVFAIIEHGVYFGDNRSLVCPKEEWELGSVITFGDSRVRILKEMNHEYNVIPIGPRIHYAETDTDYYKELYDQIDHSGKVLTLYPAHSLSANKSSYDSSLFLKQAEELAEKIGAKTIMVSLHPSDYLHHLDLRFKDSKIIIVGGGNNSFKFLPRLRAIFELSDVTFSNALGTHVGYSVYMGTPHVLNIESNHTTYMNPVFEKEQNRFASLFNGENPLVISDNQRKLCDYYFGFSHIKTPKQLFNCLNSCKVEYERRYKRH